MKMNLKFGQWFAGAAFVATLCGAGVAEAATFTAALTGDQVVPGTRSAARRGFLVS